MSNVLDSLRDAISSKHEIKLSPVDDIASAESLVIKNKDNETTLSLAEKLQFGNIDTNLRAVFNAWINKDVLSVDYISKSKAQKIDTFNFKNKNDLIHFLESSDPAAQSGSSKRTADVGISGQKATDPGAVSSGELTQSGPAADAAGAAGGKAVTEDFDEFSNFEQPLLNETMFQGERMIDFSYLIKDAQLKIINELKNDKRKPGTKGVSKSGASSSTHGSAGSSKSRKKIETPIILLSPSTSALLQMQNVKQFLENGVFQEPKSLTFNSNSANLLKIKKKLPNLGEQSFLILNSTENFTKPEYWNRVAAIFTTGQTWQFKNYLIHDPEKLFQKYKGFYLSFKGDPPNKNVDNWNVETVTIDRNRRFNDKEISEKLWESLEKSMIARGFKSVH